MNRTLPILVALFATAVLSVSVPSATAVVDRACELHGICMQELVCVYYPSTCGIGYDVLNECVGGRIVTFPDVQGGLEAFLDRMLNCQLS